MKSIGKNSSVEDICNYLIELEIKSPVKKFKEERIKGNEIFYLTDDDFKKFQMGLTKGKLKKQLDQIKKESPLILKFDENIYSDSNEMEVINFLKKEILLEENILEKFKEINGEKFIKLNDEDLISREVKLGERRKILAYISTIKKKQKPKEIVCKDISKTSTVEEVCLFLMKKLNLSDNVVNKFREFEVKGENLFEMGEKGDELNDLEIDKEIQNKIMDYINKRKEEIEKEEEKRKKKEEEEKRKKEEEEKRKKEEEEKRKKEEEEEEDEEEEEKEENFKNFHLIDIEDYITSEDEYNKCPFNKTEGFIELCNFFNIYNKENCSDINFEDASSKQLKVSTLWGTIDALFEFFEKKNMKNILTAFKEKGNDLGGIYLLINEKKNFAYVLIWPGKMKYFYRRLEEPKKDLLLSLVRMGFSLSDNNIICLTEKQDKEFQINNGIKSRTIYEAQEGNTNNEDNLDGYFHFGEDLGINFESDKDEKIKDFKLNDSSVFLYISKKEIIETKNFNKIPNYKINFNVQNVIINQKFELTNSNLYNFLNQFNCLKNLLLEEEYFKIIELKSQKLKKNKEQVQRLEKYINKIISCLSKISCEICLKKNNDSLIAFYSKENSFIIAHERCSKNNITIIGDHKIIITTKSLKENIKELIGLFYEANLNDNFSYLNNQLANFIVDIDKSITSDFIAKIFNSYNKYLESFMDNIKQYLEENEQKILDEDNEIINSFNKWKMNIINKIDEYHKSNYNYINTWL